MARPLSFNRARILHRLLQGSALRSELRQLTGKSSNQIGSLIFRLREEGFEILTASTSESRNPRYTLLRGPGTLAVGGPFVCPRCSVTVERPSDHRKYCPYGAKS